MIKKKYTKRALMHELILCSKSAAYFINTHCFISHPTLGKIQFKLYDFQEECISDYEDNRFNIILKSRQLGLSTTTAAYVLWVVLFHPGKEVVIIANKQKAAHNFMRKIKFMARHLPKQFLPGIVNDSMGEFSFTNESKVSAVATTKDAGRSEALSLLIIDEAAIIEHEKIEDLWTAAYPTLSHGGQAIIISTPKGVGNFYHQQWEGAREGSNLFNRIQLHWTRHPVFSEGKTLDEKGNWTSPWYREQCKQLLNDPRRIAQELDLSFLGSGDNVIQDEYVREHRGNILQPIEQDKMNGDLWVWEKPLPHEHYIVAADIARGDGNDFSTFHVIKTSNLEQVAEFRSKIPPDIFANLLFDIGIEYNGATMIPEANSIGYATCLKLVEMGYPNMYHSTPGRQHGSNMHRKMAKEGKQIPGFQTTSKTRPMVIARFEEAIRTGDVIIHSHRLISEIGTFIWKNGKAQAMLNYNDDLIIAMGIGLYVLATDLKALAGFKAINEAMLDSFRSESRMVSNNDSEIFNTTDNNRGLMSYIDEMGNVQDLSWLMD
jgi:hypothetical protein